MNDRTTSVLVVDDDPDIRANIKDILDDLGYRTDTAQDGPSALHLIRQRPYDVAILDFKMPGMNGATLYREIKKLRSETVSIMITAYAGSEGVQQAKEAGTWKVLQKPVDIQALLPLVKQVENEPIVLIVDDDTDFCENLWQLLREKNYRVSLAHSEQDGLKKANEQEIGIAVVDLCLDHGEGRRVLESILEMNPNAKTILVTGYRSEMHDVIQQLTERGVAVCTKPVDMNLLFSMLKN